MDDVFEIISRRMTRLITGQMGPIEACNMVTEKVLAFQLSILTGSLEPYHNQIAANIKRLRHGS